MRRRWEDIRENGNPALQEGRRAIPPGRPWRLEAKADPKNLAMFRDHARLAGEKVRDLFATGQLTPPRSDDPVANGRKGAERLRELLQDPAYRAEFARKTSEAQGGRPMVEVACVVCGKPFTVEASRARRGQGKVCGDECFRAHQRRALAAYNAAHKEVRRLQHNPEYFDQLRALEARGPDALSALGDDEREVVRRFYGLDGGEAWAERAIARHLGRSLTWVRATRLRALEELLGLEETRDPRPSAWTDPVRGEELRAAARAHSTQRRREDPRYRQVQAALRSLPPDAFLILTEEQRRLLGLYYELDEGGERGAPLTQGQIGERLGRPPTWVNCTAQRCVRRLLRGHPAPGEREAADGTAHHRKG
jgi:hypothetical protein